MKLLFREEIKATQWFKDGDHPAVHAAREGERSRRIETILDDFWANGTISSISPGMWIVELPIGIIVLTDDEFHKLFEIVHIKKRPTICKNCHGEEYGSPCDGKAYCGGMPEMVLKRLARVGQSTEGMEL